MLVHLDESRYQSRDLSQPLRVTNRSHTRPLTNPPNWSHPRRRTIIPYPASALTPSHLHQSQPSSNPPSISSSQKSSPISHSNPIQSPIHTPQPPSFPSTMAIYSSVAPPSQQPVDIEAWSASALEALSISPSARGTGVSLSIPLDRDDEGEVLKRQCASKPRREPLRRDSLKRREALLRGKEGSRRRQRWENGECDACLSLVV